MFGIPAGPALRTGGPFSRDTAEALDERLEQLLGFGNNILPTAIDGADWEDKTLQTLPILHDYIQPTIYYEGVSIVSATEERCCEISEETGECAAHFSTLAIRKEYTGDGKALKDWYLEYIFLQRQHGGEWKFTNYNDTYNAEVSLPLKEEFCEVPYDIADLA